MQLIGPLTTLCVTFAVYCATLYPSISGGDSGELVITTCNWGMAHPPGYPTFTILAALFARVLQIGNWAWRINLLSALEGSVAAACIHSAVALLTNNSPWLGMFAGFGFAFNSTVWWYSIQGEVFGLNNMMVAILLLVSVRFFHSLSQSPPQPPSLLTAYLGAFVAGVTLTNQHTTVFYVIAVVFFVLYTLFEFKLFSFRCFLLLLLSFSSGFALYAYLPIAANQHPMDGWGDQRSWSGFIHHFLRREYGTFQLAAGDADSFFWLRILVYLKVLLSESTYIVPFLAVIGIAYGLLPWFPHNRSIRMMFVAWLLYFAVFHYLANLDPTRPLFLGVQARFWMQLNEYVFVWAAIGLFFIIFKLVPWIASSTQPVANSKAKSVKHTPSYMHLICAIIVTVYVAIHTAIHFRIRNHSHTACFRNQAQIILESFPANAIVFVNGDLNNNIIKYLQQCEGVRPDLQVLSLQLMSWEWFVEMQAANYNVTFPGNRYHPHVPGGFSLKTFIDANIPKRRVFICGPFKDGDNSHSISYETVPFGLCEEIVRLGSVPYPPKKWAKYLSKSMRALPRMSELGEWQPVQFTEDSWERVLFADYWKRRVYLSRYVGFHANKLLNAGKEKQLRALLTLAAESWDEVFAHSEFSLVNEALQLQDYRDAGIIYGQLSGKVADASEADVLETKMFRYWGVYVQNKPNDNEVKVFVDDAVNPYQRR